MNIAQAPDNEHTQPASADSAGRPWIGRELTSRGFADDLGAGDPGLLAALEDPHDELTLMRAVARARLLVPVLAVPREGEQSGEAAPKRSTDLAVVTLTAPDGQRAFPVFSSLGALCAWNASARASPVTSARAAQGAVSERCDVLVLDCGSAREATLRPSMVWALAQQRDWLPAHADPFVAAALARAVADEEDVIDCVGEGDPAVGALLRVVLGLRAGLEPAEVAALATRVGQRIATDGEARARIDALSFSIRRG